MFSKLSGEVDNIKPTEVVIDVHGIGFQLAIPFSTYERIQNSTSVKLYVHTYVREDQLRLYGFFSEEEKKLFELLIRVNGIGPAMALSILSGITMQDLMDSVQNNNVSVLVSIPGIGKSKAEKIIFELKRKIKKLEHFHGDDSRQSSIRNDAVDALVSLGFDEKKSAKAIHDLLQDAPGLSLEELVKSVLQRISETSL
jgi:holliday junction DNA helicase RuvA